MKKYERLEGETCVASRSQRVDRGLLNGAKIKHRASGDSDDKYGNHKGTSNDDWTLVYICIDFLLRGHLTRRVGRRFSTVMQT